MTPSPLLSGTALGTDGVQERLNQGFHILAACCIFFMKHHQSEKANET